MKNSILFLLVLISASAYSQNTEYKVASYLTEGNKAPNTFLSMVNGSFEGDTEKTRSQLLEYCKLDTYAMVKILERLYKV